MKQTTLIALIATGVGTVVQLTI